MHKLKTKNVKCKIIIAFLLFTFYFLSGCQNKPLYKDTRVLMGTFVEVISPDKQAAGIVFGEFERLENILSKYKPESEVAKLNKNGKIIASSETFYIIKRAKEFYQITGGAFDITVALLLDIWGFTNKDFHQPSEEEIRKALKLVGSDKINLNPDNNVIEFSLPGIKIDLGGIAKGYALDAAVKKLKEGEIQSCLINAGGQIYCLGDRFGKPWKIAIKNPLKEKSIEILELKNRGVSTSGDYEQFFTTDKARYSHIFNPKTGRPADSYITSVSVISTDNLTADALSTAIFVLGEKQGLKLLEKFPDTSVKIIPAR